MSPLFRRCTFVVLILFILPSTLEARRPKRVRDRVPQELLGSTDSLTRENAVVDGEGLIRIADVDELRALISTGMLIPVKESRDVVFDDDLGTLDRENVSLYRHARPWVARLVADLGRDMRRALGRRMVVASLVRTEAYQQELIKINSSAATGLTPETRSSHITGSTVDISTKGLSRGEKKWLRRRLLALEAKGLVQATEERSTRCFHVMVFPGYGGLRPFQTPRTLPNDHSCTQR